MGDVGGGGVHSWAIFGDVVGFQASLALICQGLNEKPQKDLKSSLSQGQEINGESSRELGKTPEAS